MTHAVADARSLALHRAVAARLRSDPALVERARARVLCWREDGSVHPHSCAEWERILAGTPLEIAAFLERDDEEARALRQASPFAGVLEARERWRLLRQVTT